MPVFTRPVGDTLRALLAGWVVLIFGTSTLLYFLAPLPHPAYHAQPALNTLRGIWKVADAMGPAVKLSLVGVFGALLFAFRPMLRKTPGWLYGGSIVAAGTAVLLVLAALPTSLSRGYGIGLTGQRFDASLLPLYLAGAALGGAAFAFTLRRLEKKA